MRRSVSIAISAAVLAAAAAPAQAASTSVDGTGNIERMTVTNGKRAVKVKVFGLAGPCDAKQLHVRVLWKSSAYAAEAGCYPGATWDASLVYHADRDSGQGGDILDCDGFRFRYVDGVWRIRIPRKCISKAPNRIRVDAAGVDYASPTPGSAGPTKRLRRG